MFRDNGPAILAEEQGGSLEASAEDLGRISVPTCWSRARTRRRCSVA
jgi:hypothetical protein